LSRLLLDFLGFTILTLTFIFNTFSVIKSPHPEKYFIYYAFIEILGYLFFSISGVAIVGALSSILMIIILIITGKIFTLLAIILYVAIILFCLFLEEKIYEREGERKLEIEKIQDKTSDLKIKIEELEGKIPILENLILKYGKLSEFLIRIGSTFNIEEIARITREFLNEIYKDSLVEITLDRSIPYINFIFDSRTPLLVEDIRKDFRFQDMKTTDFVSLISAPVFRENEIFTCIVVKSKNRNFDVRDLRFLGFIATFVSLSVSNFFLYEKTKELAIHDSLTGLYTHLYFMERLKEELNFAGSIGENFTFLMIDIDNFKKFNDTYGHQNGDIVLKRVAEKLKKLLRETDIVGRYGGEEFSVILPFTGKKDGVEIAERIRRGIEEESFNFKGETVHVTVTIGCSFFPEEKTLNEIVRKADIALYKGKREGKNRVVSC